MHKNQIKSIFSISASSKFGNGMCTKLRLNYNDLRKKNFSYLLLYFHIAFFLCGEIYKCFLSMWVKVRRYCIFVDTVFFVYPRMRMYLCTYSKYTPYIKWRILKKKHCARVVSHLNFTLLHFRFCIRAIFEIIFLYMHYGKCFILNHVLYCIDITLRRIVIENLLKMCSNRLVSTRHSR